MMTGLSIESIQALDDKVLLAVNSLHNSFFDQVFYMISDRFVWVFFYISLAYLLYKTTNLRTAILSLLTIAVLITIADQTAVHVMRPLFPRFRPAYPENPISPFVHIVNGYRSGRCGFPSAHAANSFALATWCSMAFRRRILILVLFLWALLLCYSRAYLGVHYVGDLLCGALLGTVAGVFVFLAGKKYLKLSYVRPQKEVFIPIAACFATFAGIFLVAAI